MSDHLRDQRLRDAFARLSREIAPQAPDAARFVGRARSARGRAHPRSLAPGLALASVLAVLAVVAFWGARRAGEREIVARQAAQLGNGRWRAPTDFLLDVPGAELLRTTPSFDTSPPTLPSSWETVT